MGLCLASVMLAGCGRVNDKATGFAEARGHTDVVAFSDTHHLQTFCAGDGYPAAFASAQGYGLVCVGHNRTWLLAEGRRAKP